MTNIHKNLTTIKKVSTKNETPKGKQMNNTP